MNLQHERMLALCELLNLRSWRGRTPVAAQDAARQEIAYSGFLEGLLKMEAAERNVRESRTCSHAWPVPGHQHTGWLRL